MAVDDLKKKEQETQSEDQLDTSKIEEKEEQEAIKKGQANDPVLNSTTKKNHKENSLEAEEIDPEKIKTVSAEFEQKFIEGRNGRYHWKNSPDTVAFRDKSDKMISAAGSKAETTLARNMTDLAESKGWTSLKVRGSSEYKQAVWQEAMLRGIEVKGYKPTELEQKMMDEKLNKIEVLEKSSDKTIETERTDPTMERYAVLKKSFENKDKEQALKEHPELQKVYHLQAASKAFAEERISDPQQQEQFVTSINDKAITELSKGKDLPDVIIKESHRINQEQEAVGSEER